MKRWQAKHSRKMVKAANFVNAILRRFGREKTELLVKAEKQPTVRFNAPDWWIRRYEAVFGEQTPEILRSSKASADDASR